MSRGSGDYSPRGEYVRRRVGRGRQRVRVDVHQVDVLVAVQRGDQVADLGLDQAAELQQVVLRLGRHHDHQVMSAEETVIR